MTSHYQLVVFDWEGTISDLTSDYVYSASSPLQIRLVPGVKTCIERLVAAHMKLAIATNKHEQSLRLDLKASGLQSYFAITRSANQTAPKPHPQMLMDILTYFRLSPAQALMIGDATWDMEMASKIHMDCIGIDVACQNEASLLRSGAKQVFRNYEEVIAFILTCHSPDRHSE